MVINIRKYAKEAIVIVGTPTWSQDVDVASMSPIKNSKNIMYAIHFYAATHQDYYMNKVKKAISWDNVGPTVTYFVTAFTRTFNSLVDNIDWDIL